MTCPNCGTPTLVDQQFCRACGAELIPKEKRRFSRRFWGLAMLMWMFFGLMVSMTGKLFELRWLTFTGVFLMMGGMFGLAAFAMFQQSRPRKVRTNNSPALELQRADTTNKLQLPVGENDFIPSVIEGTTELLKTPAHVSNDKNTIA